MHVRAKKSLGQNFLRDSSFVERIVNALDPGDTDIVFEIGPGQGALTAQLIKRAGRLIAIEFDRDMIAILAERFRSAGNFELIKADALNVDFSSLLGVGTKKAKLVANLPYNISTPILQRLIDQREIFSEIVLMFQREVVERITAPAGGKERGFLSVLVENAFEADYLFDVPPGAFQPVPKVWSGVVRLIPKPATTKDYPLFKKIVSASFAQKRKTMLNNLRQAVEDAQGLLAKAEIDARRRAETLTLDEWWKLTRTIARSRSVRDDRDTI